MSIEDFENALSSKLAHEVGEREPLLYARAWERLLGPVKYEKLLAYAEIEHKGSSLLLVTDLIGFERLLKELQITVAVVEMGSIKIRDEHYNVIKVKKRVELHLHDWPRRV